MGSLEQFIISILVLGILQKRFSGCLNAQKTTSSRSWSCDLCNYFIIQQFQPFFLFFREEEEEEEMDEDILFPQILSKFIFESMQNLKNLTYLDLCFERSPDTASQTD